MRKYEYLFIDADETLFDFETAEKRALMETYQAFDLPYTEETVALYHRINKGLWSDLEKGLIDQDGIKVERFNQVLKALDSSKDAKTVASFYMDALGKGTDLLPGALDLVKDLKESYKICIITNGIEIIQTQRIGQSAIATYIDQIIISEAVGYSKPDTRIFEFAMNQTGMTDKGKVVMIGDSLSSDIKGGNDFGIDTIWVNLSHQQSSDHVKPTHEVNRLEDIPNCL